MKTTTTPSFLRLGQAALLASCALLLAHVQASAATIGVDLGAVGIKTGATIPPAQFDNLGVFALGVGLGSGNAIGLMDSATINGDAAAEGSGKVTLNNSAKILGRLSRKTGGVLTKDPGATITTIIPTSGATDSLLTTGSAAAISASNTAAGFAATGTIAGNKINNINLTLGTNAFSGMAVYNLTDITLNQSFKLTLTGTAQSAYVFNVTNDFKLTDTASIVLAGGLTWDHVLFNLRGTKKGEILKKASVNGIILGTGRTLDLGGGNSDTAMINGAVIVNQFDADGLTKVTRPPIVSPL